MSGAPLVATLSKYPPYVSGHAVQAHWNDVALAELAGRPQHQLSYCGPVPAEWADDRVVVHHVAPAPGSNPKVRDGHLEKALAGAFVGLGRDAGVEVLLTYYADPHAGIALRARRTLARLGRRVCAVASVEGSDLTDSLQRHVDDREAAVIAADLLDADVLLAVSEYVAAELATTVGKVLGPAAGDEAARRVVVRHPGLPAECFVRPPAAAVAGLRARLRVPEGAPLVSTYVRLVPEKGVLLLLDAAERLAATHPAAVLVIAGDGPLAGELEAQVAARGLGGVRVAPGLGWHDAAALRAGSSLGVFPVLPTPVWTETFGIAPLEYQALGVPVLVTRTGGTAESTALPEFRVPEGADAGAWAAAIGAALDAGPGRGQPARAFAERFTAARAAGIIVGEVDRWRAGGPAAGRG